MPVSQLETALSVLINETQPENKEATASAARTEDVCCMVLGSPYSQGEPTNPHFVMLACP